MCPEVKIVIKIHEVHVLAHSDSKPDVLWVSVPEERLVLGIKLSLNTSTTINSKLNPLKPIHLIYLSVNLFVSSKVFFIICIMFEEFIFI